MQSKKAVIDYDIGAGWEPYVTPLVSLCNSRGGTVVQVKEKFGGLRFYYDTPPGFDRHTEDREFWKAFDNLVVATERICWYICEVTGDPGKLRQKGADGKYRWNRVLCDEEATKQGYSV